MSRRPGTMSWITLIELLVLAVLNQESHGKEIERLIFVIMEGRIPRKTLKASHVLRRMEKKGYVRRRANGTNKRGMKRIYRRTEEGDAILGIFSELLTKSK